MKPLVYQLFVRLFGNKFTQFSFDGSLEENGCGRFNDIDNEALRALKDMHYTHIWYTGVLAHASLSSYEHFGIPDSHPMITKGKAGSPYAIRDYYDVDPDLSVHPEKRMNEFIDLLHRTHNSDLKAIIDFVPNHVARQYISISKPAGVQDFGETDDTTLPFHPQNNFYYIPDQSLDIQGDFDSLSDRYIEYPAKVTGNDQFTASPNKNDWYETIKLNYGVDYQNGQTAHFNPIPSTWLKMRDILLFWADKGVDGFRCDMAEMVPVEFWKWVIHEVKSVYPDVIFIAEIYKPWEYHQYIFDGGFDYLYDKMGLYDTLRRIIEKGNSTHEISGVWQNLNGLDAFMLRFIENHDEQRIASPHFAGTAQKGIPAMAIATFMHNGPLMVYNGQEDGENAEGETGFSGNDGRTSIFDYCHMPLHQKWMHNGKFDGELSGINQSGLRNEYRDILSIVQQFETFSSGQFYDLMYVNSDIHRQYAFLRYDEQQAFLVISSFCNFEVRIKLHIPLHAIGELHLEASRKLILNNIITQKTELEITGYEAAYGGIPIRLAPNSYKVLRIIQE